MTESAKEDLQRYLQAGRTALLWKLDGLSEYDMRRPMTPTGTNLLGLIKHLTVVELGYFGWTFDRPFHEAVPWAEEGEDPHADLWAKADESTEYIVGLYRQIWEHSDRTIAELPLDATGVVPHWPRERATVTLHRIVVHVIADMDRHAGHADILRELIDGSVGLTLGNENMPPDETAFWADHRARVEEHARRYQP
ncbi:MULTISPECIES: DinB family protein [Nocardiaceae]|uniref:DinB family protein n=1 Tax=Nocardiaceae TaxID=85025 RepID=UPI00055A440D|nr:MULTISPECIES: DinB family protein [Rhodococcus]OZF57047.1 DinB family protein [Rhodococcus sp. 14-2470-1a]